MIFPFKKSKSCCESLWLFVIAGNPIPLELFPETIALLNWLCVKGITSDYVIRIFCPWGSSTLEITERPMFRIPEPWMPLDLDIFYNPRWAIFPFCLCRRICCGNAAISPIVWISLLLYGTNCSAFSAPFCWTGTCT